jgi:hypothetical protein
MHGRAAARKLARDGAADDSRTNHNDFTTAGHT